MKTTLIASMVFIWVTAAAEAGVINVPGDQPTIQDGINAAISGVDEVIVAPGTYTEAINFLGKAITVRSASDDPTDTTIDGTGNFHVVLCISGEGAGSVLEGFTITGGDANGANPNDRGGGMRILNSSPMVRNCIFESNSAGSLGGGMAVRSGSPVISECVFHDNTAGDAAAMYTNIASPTITGCIFSENIGVNTGGIRNQNPGTPRITNCIIRNNTGSGVGNSNGAAPILTNCTIFDNTKFGIQSSTSSNTQVINSIIWDNDTGSITDSGSTTTVTYSNVQGGVLPGAGNISVDPPGFVNPAAGDLRLQAGSPGLDVGNNAALPFGVTTDIAGLPRISNGTVDMGAHELQDDDGDGVPNDDDVCPGFDDNGPDADNDTIPDVCDICNGFDDTLDGDGDGIPDGCDTPTVHNLDELTDHFTIQDAIDNAEIDDEIIVDPGVYHESVDFDGQPMTVRSTSGVPTDTIIDGTGFFHAVIFDDDEDTDTILEGFTITGGNANGTDFDDSGGGILINASTPTVQHCVIQHNLATFGGGLYFTGTGTPQILHCRFIENTATSVGGAIVNVSGGMARIEYCDFIDNTADNDSGAIRNDGTGTNPSIRFCTFTGNNAILGGAMLNSNESAPVVQACDFTNNIASSSPSSRGGGMSNSGGSAPTVIDCTFEGNVANFGAGMYNTDFGAVALVFNCRFIGNSGAAGAGIYCGYTASPMVVNTLFTGNSVTGNGGAMFSFNQSNPQIINSTFSHNTAGVDGGGLATSNLEGDATISNSVFWGNSDAGGMDESAQIFVGAGAFTPAVSYSNVQGDWSGIGAGNINFDPMFVDADGPDDIFGTADDNARLQAGSRCIDAGDTTAIPVGVFGDLDGNARAIDDPARANLGIPVVGVVIAAVDMGAYEFQSDIPCTPLIEGDINCDGVVDYLDLALMAANWLATI